LSNVGLNLNLSLSQLCWKTRCAVFVARNQHKVAVDI